MLLFCCITCLICAYTILNWSCLIIGLDLHNSVLLQVIKHTSQWLTQAASTTAGQSCLIDMRSCSCTLLESGARLWARSRCVSSVWARPTIHHHSPFNLYSDADPFRASAMVGLTSFLCILAGLTAEYRPNLKIWGGLWSICVYFIDDRSF